jgi:peptidyl-prolyl cis-trans isomerase NIMA-interacting 1
MPDDEKKKVTSLPPPTDDVDKDWSRPSGAPPEVKESKSSGEPSTKKPASDPKSDLEPPPWKKSEKAKPRDDEDDDDEDDDDDDAVDEDAVDEDEDDEDDDDDDDDEDDDEDETDRRKPQAAKGEKSRGQQKPSARKTPTPQTSEDWLPDWSPWAVLGTLLFLGFLGGFGFLPIDFNLKPSAAPESSALPTVSSAPTPRPGASALRESMRERRRRSMGADGGTDGASIRASHLLVGFQGSSLPNQTRSKAEAKTRAEEAMKRAKKGEDFAKVVAAYTDEPGGAQRGGDLNRFGRGRMVPAFEEAAFALKPNEVSGVVETQFGFHVIKRTE